MPEQSDILRVEGINSKGYGTIPKMVMQDIRLSISAKAIYGYFCTYAGAGRQAFPRVTKIIKDLGISKNAYYKHFGLLKQYGYIKAEQEHVDGRLSHNIYTLLTEIQCTKIRDTVQCTKIQDTVIQDTVFCDTNIINSSKNYQYLKSNNSSCRTKPPKAADVTDRVDKFTKTVMEQISYSDFTLSHPLDIPLLDEIVTIIVDALMTDGKSVRIDGESKPRELLRHQLNKLNYDNIEFVVGQFKGYTGRIRKKRQFILTMLYNSSMELDAHYTNEVKSDSNSAGGAL